MLNLILGSRPNSINDLKAEAPLADRGTVANMLARIFMQRAYQHHDIPDNIWERLAPHLPGRDGVRGTTAQDNRLFLNAVFWVLRTGEPWRALPPDYGDWKNIHRRFCRWRDKGVWENLLALLATGQESEQQPKT